MLCAPEAAGPMKIFSRSGKNVETGTGLVSWRASTIHMKLAVPEFLPRRASSVTTRYGLSPIGQQVWVEPANGGDHCVCPTSSMLRRSVQSMIDMRRPTMRNTCGFHGIIGGPCNVMALSAGIGSLPSAVIRIPLKARGRQHLGLAMAEAEITRWQTIRCRPKAPSRCTARR